MKKERKTALPADPARLKAHFERCLQAQYVHTAMGGDYAIEARGNTLYLLFEWSDGGEDWINNLDFPATPYRRMEQTWFCHRGFLRVWRALRDEVEPAVESMLHRRPWIREIVCIGYSHGAAMAVLACEDMTFLYGKRLEVSGYGFGTPRVLWGPIPRAVKSRLSAFYATVCVPDLVTTVPPKWLGFRDVGIRVEIGAEKGYAPVHAHYAQSYLDALDTQIRENTAETVKTAVGVPDKS